MKQCPLLQIEEVYQLLLVSFISKEYKPTLKYLVRLHFQARFHPQERKKKKKENESFFRTVLWKMVQMLKNVTRVLHTSRVTA